MSKQAMIDTRIFIFMNEYDLMIDERLVYLFLMMCPSRLIHGLFEISVHEISYNTGVSRDRVIPILASLQNNKLIYYSNRLVFVPQIAEFESFVNRLHSGNKISIKSFENALSRYLTWRGEVSAVNNAYRAFCDFYADDIDFLKLAPTVGRPSHDLHTTVGRPSGDPHTTVADSDQFRPLPTHFPIKQPEINDLHTTVGRPSHEGIGKGIRKGIRKGIEEYSPFRKGGAGENHQGNNSPEKNFDHEIIEDEEYDIDDFIED